MSDLDYRSDLDYMVSVFYSKNIIHKLPIKAIREIATNYINLKNHPEKTGFISTTTLLTPFHFKIPRTVNRSYTTVIT